MDGIITMIYFKQAKIGYQFQHIGESKACKSCKLYKACIKNLKLKAIYEVIEVRNKIHYCPLIDDDVKVVKVKELPIDTYIDSSSAFEGAIITYRGHDCSEENCPHHEKCFDERLVRGRKYKILKIIENKKVQCLKGKALKLVKLKII
ncbi:MAG: UPF0179 family protein [Candidatus Helarchaeota archaeon]